jgi:hypothetical protein
MEGVYFDRTEAGRKPRFFIAVPPRDADIITILQTISHRVIRKLRRLDMSRIDGPHKEILELRRFCHDSADDPAALASSWCDDDRDSRRAPTQYAEANGRFSMRLAS